MTAARKVTVWVQRMSDRDSLALQWHDSKTGRRRSRSSGTNDASLAEQKRLDLENELNRDGFEFPPKPLKKLRKSRPAALRGVTERIREFKIRRRRCVYFLMRGEQVIYVGKTKNLIARIAYHQSNKKFDRVFYVTPENVDQTELEYIEFLQPELNVQGVG